MSKPEESKVAQTELKRPTPVSSFVDNSAEPLNEMKRNRSPFAMSNPGHNFVNSNDKEFAGVPVTTIQISNKERDVSAGGSRKF